MGARIIRNRHRLWRQFGIPNPFIRIETKNFGPISSANFTAKPLTMCVGPNNSGKSYLALLVHAIIRAYRRPWATPRRIESFDDIPFGRLRLDIAQDNDFLQFLKRVGKLHDGEKLEVHQALVDRVAVPILKEIFEKWLPEELRGFFQCNLGELTRHGRRPFQLKVAVGHYDIHLQCSRDTLVVNRATPQSDPGPKVTYIRDRSLGTRSKILRERDSVTHRFGIWPLEEPHRTETVLGLVSDFLSSCNQFVEGDFPPYSHYLPAGRSALLTVRHPLVRALVRGSSDAIERRDDHALSGIFSDFLDSFVSPPEKPGPFYDIAEALEQEALGGSLIIKEPAEFGIPEIRYVSNGHEIPLNRASSAVGELGGITLYLKHFVKESDLVIIEEPEAHLHPANQRVLASFITRLVRAKLRVLITTHSDFLLEQLNHFILLSDVPKEKREIHPYGAEVYLKPDEASAHLLYRDGRSPAFRTKFLDIIEGYGIPESEFTDVSEALNEELYSIESDMTRVQ